MEAMDPTPKVMRLDFITGEPTDLMICQFTPTHDGIVGVCGDFNTLKNSKRKQNVSAWNEL